MPRVAQVPPDVDVSAEATLHALLLGALSLGAVALLSFPGLRTGVTAFGWAPLWLIGIPVVAWLTLFLRRLLRRRKLTSSAVVRWGRPSPAQAHRRAQPRRRVRNRMRVILVAAGLLPGGR